jgi:hypothetical protein
MAAYNPGLCSPWITNAEFLSCCSSVDEDTTTEQITTAVEIASNSLYLMSGRQFRGDCTKTVTVCRENCRNTRADLRCEAENEISIGFWPITRLESIKFDGIEQLPARDEDTDEFVTDPNFQINDYRYIEKLDGKWPIQPGGEDQEVEITFVYGISPPEAGKEAVKALASQILDALCRKSCSLPDRATHITRRGTSITIQDYDILAQDFLGIYAVDLFLQAYNPTKTRMQSFVLQPGRRAKVRRKNT